MLSTSTKCLNEAFMCHFVNLFLCNLIFITTLLQQEPFRKVRFGVINLFQHKNIVDKVKPIKIPFRNPVLMSE
ncbi:CLUMA_CG001036, isoform A [Clunio marinus]|uniref:CLUMA_CG001036, isoform A n=1 Tax=Clunio marinus TaxID=568069 RepID=A0A1J1HGU2_9DIPT|nr:CLUMA_CG001036, isoform A [Clunio marinus]